MMQKHFVTFYSPGTFVAETSVREIPSWDVNMAVAMSHSIKERYGATPYAFQFSTRARGENDLDSKVVRRSGFYFLGGKVETVEEVRTRNDPKEKILLSNMEGNGYKRIVINTNSWKWTQPLEENDVVLEYTPN